MDSKELKKLVKACRELGVLHYKTPEIEFTLSHDAPIKESKLTKGTRLESMSANDKFETDSLTEEQLLMWSSTPGGMPFSNEQESG